MEQMEIDTRLLERRIGIVAVDVMVRILAQTDVMIVVWCGGLVAWQRDGTMAWQRSDIVPL